MKKLLLLSFILGFFYSANAQNNLVVFNMDGNQFYIILNGIKQNAEPKTNVKIENLTGDTYKLKIIFADGTTPDVDKSIYFADPNHEYVTEVKKNKKGEYKLRMVSYGPTAQNNYQAASTINYTNTNAVSNTNNGVVNNNTSSATSGNNNTTSTTTNSSTVTTTTQINETTTGNGENVNVNMNVGGVDMNVNLNVNETGGNTNLNTNMNGSNTTTTSHTTTTTTTTTGNTNTSNANMNTNTGTSSGCYMSTTDINSVVNAVKGETFADDKKMVAKQALKSKCISSDQVVTLLKEYTFEGDKVEMAKYCYDRCSDRDNYYKVNSAFTHSSSKEELNEYIESK